MNDPDTLQLSWDRVKELLRAAVAPPPEQKKIRTPSARARMYYELWRFGNLSQRQIAARHQTSQSAVARACRAVPKWLGRADGKKLGELSAEEKYRALVRTHERKVLYAERRHLRDYRRSALPLKTTKIRVRKKADEAQGELERWEETVVKTQRRDGRCLERYVKLSRDEVNMAARSLPRPPGGSNSRYASASQASAAPGGADPSADQAADPLAWIDQLIDELQYLHQEYTERLTHHQRMYGFMDEYGLKREFAPSIPLGGWVKRYDFSARRDQPGAFTNDNDWKSHVTAESVYGPPEQWQTGTPEWFERKRREEASDQPPPDLTPEWVKEEMRRTSESPPLLPGEAPTYTPTFPGGCSAADSADSSPLADSGQNSEKPRENQPESACWPARAADSQTDSVGAWRPGYDAVGVWRDPNDPPPPKKKLPEGMPSMTFEWYD